MLVVGLLLLICLSVTKGALKIDLNEVLDIFLTQLGWSNDGNFTAGQQGVLISIRLPRTALTIMVGAGLSVAGALMQGLFRNPLADPGLLGVSSGAALGATLAIVLLLPAGWNSPWALPVAAFVGAVISTVVVMRLSQAGSKTIVANMLLAGIAINAIAGSATGWLVYMATDDQLRDLTFWSLGSFGGASWSDVQVGALLIALPTALALLMSRALNVMLLGESDAWMLGLNIQRMKHTIVTLVCIIVGTAVSLTGMIGFVGLVVPHLCRLLFGPDNRRVVPMSALLGASLLLAADVLSRLIILPAELPIGIVTAMVGGPFFLMLLLSKKSQGLR
ncbi:MAG TPA: Fe3+-siderophore ABC transporter permease [Myxococcales bacterium]|nr:Fe3+-siderophore ABC transporter permease [Myxococcales bacterium]